MLITKSKKSNISIIILVFLILIVCSASLFIFATSDKKVKVKISDVGLIQDAQLKQEVAEFYIYEAIEKSMVNPYREMLNQDKYIESPSYNLQNKIEFANLYGNLNDYFYSEFRNRFKNEFENYAFQEEYLNNLKNLIAQDKFSSSFDGENLIFETSLLEIKSTSEKNSVVYFPEIFLNISFSRIGLNSFNAIYNSKEKCKGKETAELMKACFSNELGAFDAESAEKIISEEKKYFLISLTSKKKFLIENNFEKISFEFVAI